MDEFTSHLLHTISEPTLAETDDCHDQTQHSADTNSARKARGIRHGVFRAASLQDKLLEK